MNNFFKLALTLYTLFFISACGANNSTNDQWRVLDINNTVLLTLPQGKVVIELAPQFAPKNIAQFTRLIKKSFYNGEKFYRVIDGFVAQAGPKNGSEKDKSIALLAIENQWEAGKNWSFTPVQTDDLFAKQTGFKQGFAVATDNKNAWLTHCPGTLAMARGNKADSASSHFYFVIGQAPRYLDKMMTIVGRVVYGMEHIQAIQRTSVIAGEYAVDSRDFTAIIKMQIMADVPKAEQIIIEVENTESSLFIKRLAKSKIRNNAFFFEKPPAVLDVCQVTLRSRLIKK